MTTEHVAYCVGFFAIAAAFVWFYGPWQKFVIAWTRQGLFELRDAWFDATAFSPETRDLAAVRGIRDFYNSVIGGMELLSWPWLVVMTLWARGMELPKPRVSAQIHALPDERLKQIARRTIECAGYYVAAETFARSLVGFPYGLLLMVRAELNARSAFERGSPAAGNRSLVPSAPRTLRKKLISRELELAAAVSQDPSMARFVRRGLAA